MADGRPPRRSRRKSEPATIDLEADKTAKGTAGDAGKAPQHEGGAAGKPPSDAPGTPADAPATPAREAAGGGQPAGPASGSDDSTPAGSPPEASASPAPGKDATEGKDPTGGPAPKADPKGLPEPETPETVSAAASPSTEAGKRAAASAAASDAAKDAARRPGRAPDHGSPPPATPSAEAAGGRGFVAGLLGGVIVAVLVLALESAGILPAPGTSAAEKASSDVADLRNSVETLKKSVADLKNAPQAAAAPSDAVEKLQAQVNDLADKQSQLQAGARSAGTASASDLSDMKDALGKAGSRLDDLSATVDGIKSDVAGLKSDVARLDRQGGLAAIVAATALKSAIERGGPFDAELKVYRRVAPGDGASAKLDDLAKAGVPSHDALVAAFPDVADAILSAVRGGSGDSGIFGRLVDSARSVIRVRPTGNPEGKTPSAIVARMETKLKAGDLKGVVDEWSALPAAGQKASQSFIDRVRKRMTALAAADGALQDAMSSTGKQG